ncbi:ribonuclease p protein subunit p21 [Anaeramoeba ignava]|uniref:Ribonuclease p protein subunit p21 n=1 Tax=Anaeramoeba ignava TaxID=1746090 RepID=A0A9Q0LKQ7_ANAIG|nr:ribonuclease p protein subunit p21 [Anaeramoeba ignava]
MNKNQNQEINPKNIRDRDAYLRMNFLLQASHIVLQPKTKKKAKKSLKKSLKKDENNFNLSRFYISEMKQISRKKVIRISPEVKMLFCKNCNSLLIPGKTSTQRIQHLRQTHVIIRCNLCGFVKRFIVKKDNTQNTSVLETQKTNENVEKDDSIIEMNENEINFDFDKK